MAALQKIRSKSGLLVGIIAVGLFAFVFPWGEISTFVNKIRDKAFVVNGEVVTTKSYTERITEFENFQKMMTGQSSLDETTSSQIRESVYQQMVKEMMLGEEAEKLGLAVTSEELNDMVYGSEMSPVLYQVPFFANPQTGQFDKAYLMEFLSYINQDPMAVGEPQRSEILARRGIWSFVQNMMKYQRLEEKYTTLVASSFVPTETEAKVSFEDSKSVADIVYVAQKYSSIQDSTIQVTDKEIKALYDQRKNNYKLDGELRQISYFIKDVVPSDGDYAVVEAEINNVYEKLKTSDNPIALVNEYSSIQFVDVNYSMSSLPMKMRAFVEVAEIGDIQAPVREDQSFMTYKILDKKNMSDSIKLQIIPMPQGLDEKTSAFIADSLLTVIKGGKDFGAVADEMYPGANGGSLGWADEISLVRAGMSTKEVFAASKGEILNLDINGYRQLIKIEDKTNPVPKVKLAIIQMPVIISDKTQNAIDNELNMFVTENGNIENFDKAALDKGYPVLSNITIRPSEPFLGQTAGTRQVIHWAFNEKVGEVKKFDLSNKRIIAVVKKEIKGDYLPVSEVAAGLKLEIVADKKAEKIIADLKAKNLTSLDAYAQNIDTRVDTVKFIAFQTNNITGIGYEPIMNVYSKIGQPNKVSEPLKGRNGVYVMEIVERKEESKEFNLAESKQAIKQNNMYQLVTPSMSVLRDKMGVEDNRVKFW